MPITIGSQATEFRGNDVFIHVIGLSTRLRPMAAIFTTCIADDGYAFRIPLSSHALFSHGFHHACRRLPIYNSNQGRQNDVLVRHFFNCLMIATFVLTGGISEGVRAQRSHVQNVVHIRGRYM
jgi:hypothetical protein